MISTRNIITSIRDIPDTFILEFYLNLDRKLDGSERWIKSPFGQERTPSFSLFLKGINRYSWRDFSSGQGGSPTELVMQLFKLSKGEAVGKIMRDYQAFLIGNPDQDAGRILEHQEKYRVVGNTLRTWNSSDAKYWGRYHIKSSTLEHFNIAPIEKFDMSKKVKGEEKRITITRPRCYGYFDKTGELYKIYAPQTEVKFIKVKSHVQGDDQRQGRRNLLITKAMKDICAVYELGIPDWDIIAPCSENDLLDKRYVTKMKDDYYRIMTIMDNDPAGYTAREKYKQAYDIPFLDFNLGQKDISDSVEANGLALVRSELIRLIG